MTSNRIQCWLFNSQRISYNTCKHIFHLIYFVFVSILLLRWPKSEDKWKHCVVTRSIQISYLILIWNWSKNTDIFLYALFILFVVNTFFQFPMFSNLKTKYWHIKYSMLLKNSIFWTVLFFLQRNKLCVYNGMLF